MPAFESRDTISRDDGADDSKSPPAGGYEWPYGGLIGGDDGTDDDAQALSNSDEWFWMLNPEQLKAIGDTPQEPKE